MTYYRLLFSIGALLALFPASLKAGTFVHSIVQIYDNKDGWTYVDIRLDAGRMRMDFKTAKQSSYLIYDQATSTLESVDPTKKAILELTAADLEQMKAYLGELAAEFNSGPATQRVLPASAQKEFAAVIDQISKPTAAGVPYNGYSCAKYEFSDKKQKAFEFWTIPPAATGMAPADYQTSRGLLDMLLYVVGGALGQVGLDPEALKRFPYYREYPVMTILYKEGKPTVVYRVLSIKTQAMSSEIFAVPANYPRTDFLDVLKAVMSKLSKGPAKQAPAQP